MGNPLTSFFQLGKRYEIIYPKWRSRIPFKRMLHVFFWSHNIPHCWSLTSPYPSVPKRFSDWKTFIHTRRLGFSSDTSIPRGLVDQFAVLSKCVFSWEVFRRLRMMLLPMMLIMEYYGYVYQKIVKQMPMLQTKWRQSGFLDRQVLT